MAATGACFLPSGFSPVIRRTKASAAGTFGQPQAPSSSARRFAVSTEQASPFATTAPPPTVPSPTKPTDFEKNGRYGKREEEASRKSTTQSPFMEEIEVEGKRERLKSFFEHAKDLATRSDGGPPRWFSPLECGSRMDDSPLLLYLPGIDGTGAGLTSHHRKLGQIFDIWCLHIPVMDRTSFLDLVKMVERTVISENYRTPKRPIYLVGESLGGCLALSVAARNPGLDLVLILVNPATSFNKSQLQPLLPFLAFVPEQLQLSYPFLLSLITGDPLKMINASTGQLLSPQQTVGELSNNVLAMSHYISVLSDILPKETLLWKLRMLNFASAFTNSRVHAVKAQTLILTSGKDQLLPSQSEGERLDLALQDCDIRPFEDCGHFLFLEDGVDLVTIIKATAIYRRRWGMSHDYVSDYLPPTPSEYKRVYESNKLFYEITSPVMLSTLEDGTIVKGLAGIPREGPVLFVGYHMLLGLELIPLVSRLLNEENIHVRGIAHPMLFAKVMRGQGYGPAFYDTFRLMGAVPVSGKNFYKLLSSKSHTLLYPGGMREALHRKGEEYKLFWPEQPEFVRMAVKFGAKIVPFGTVGEDDFGEVVLDYDDLMKIPYFRDQIIELTNSNVRLRTDVNGEVANQDTHLPGILPKIPGRFYFCFGKPIETEGREQELEDREKAQELYLQVKSDVVKCMEFLKEKRKSDPYRSIFSRLVYQATHGSTSEIPTFEL